MPRGQFTRRGEFQKFCQACGQRFISPTTNKRLCETCTAERKRTSNNESQAKYKRTPKGLHTNHKYNITTRKDRGQQEPASTNARFLRD